MIPANYFKSMQLCPSNVSAFFVLHVLYFNDLFSKCQQIPSFSMTYRYLLNVGLKDRFISYCQDKYLFIPNIRNCRFAFDRTLSSAAFIY